MSGECDECSEHTLDCTCESGYMKDRYIENLPSCPACDPHLGKTPEIRIQNYKLLISHPVPKTTLELYDNI